MKPAKARAISSLSCGIWRRIKIMVAMMEETRQFPSSAQKTRPFIPWITDHGTRHMIFPTSPKYPA